MKMKKLFVIVTALLMISAGAGAQIGNHNPQYSAYYHRLIYTNPPIAVDDYGGIVDGIGANRRWVNAILYPPHMFGAPAGKITHIYVAGNGWPNVPSNRHYYQPTI